jgi:hypothetical protein
MYELPMKKQKKSTWLCFNPSKAQTKEELEWGKIPTPPLFPHRIKSQTPELRQGKMAVSALSPHRSEAHAETQTYQHQEEEEQSVAASNNSSSHHRSDEEAEIQEEVVASPAFSPRQSEAELRQVESQKGEKSRGEIATIGLELGKINFQKYWPDQMKQLKIYRREISEPQVFMILRQILLGLDALHSIGINLFYQ